MKAERKPPARKCVGCNEMLDKNSLIRVVRGADGVVCVDLTGKKSGRGAYIHKSPDCLKTARKKRSLERALKSQIPDEVYGFLDGETS